jgi:predicted kinase
VLIVLGGLPGVGKTTIARELARQLGGMHLRIDSIEEAIRQSGVVAVSLDDAGYRVAYAVAADNLRLGRTVIADSVNPWPITRDAWRAVAERTAVPAIEIEITCTDLAEHRRRVEARALSDGGPTWQDVVTRDYRPWHGPHVVIDTAGRPAEESVAAILRALERALHNSAH